MLNIMKSKFSVIFSSLLVAFTLAAMPACTSAPLNNQIDATSSALNSISIQLENLERAGFIEDRKEDELQRRLLKAHNLLQDRVAPLPDRSICEGAATRLECVEIVMAETLIYLETINYGNDSDN